MKFEQNWLSGFRGESFENVNGRTHGPTTDDGRKVITIAHPEQSSGELKISWWDWSFNPGPHYQGLVGPVNLPNHTVPGQKLITALLESVEGYHFTTC